MCGLERRAQANSRRRIDNSFDDIKTGADPLAWDKGMEDTCLLSMWCPVFRERDSSPGFRTELENLAGDAKGKGTRAENPRPKVPRGQIAKCRTHNRFSLSVRMNHSAQ